MKHLWFWNYQDTRLPLAIVSVKNGHKRTCPWSAEPLYSQKLIPDEGSYATNLLLPSVASTEELYTASDHITRGPQKLNLISGDATWEKSISILTKPKRKYPQFSILNVKLKIFHCFFRLWASKIPHMWDNDILNVSGVRSSVSPVTWH